MIIALSGSRGFIGSHLREMFESQGHSVHAIDRDLLYSPYALESYLQKIHPSVIIHAAAYGNMASHDDEDEVFDANVTKTYTLLQASYSIPYTHFLFISSSSVSLPVQTLYSATKSASEKLCIFFRQQGKNIGIVRPYTIIGPREPSEHLTPKLVRSCLYMEEMPFVKEPHHDFLDVRDLCSAIGILIQQEKLPTITPIGSGISRSNLEILQEIELLTKRKANIQEVQKLRDFDTEHWVADISTIKELGWRQQYSLQQTLEDMIEYEKD